MQLSTSSKQTFKTCVFQSMQILQYDAFSVNVYREFILILGISHSVKKRKAENLLLNKSYKRKFIF